MKTKNKQVSAILVAAGSGSRLKKTAKLGSELPKAFLPLGNKPLLIHSLDSLLDSKTVSEIVVALPEKDYVSYKNYIKPYVRKNNKKLKWVQGGKTRLDSVYNGFKKVDKGSDWVLVHDAARPFVSEESISQVIKKAQQKGAAILASPVSSTVKQSKQPHKSKTGNSISKTISRDFLWDAETPQVSRKDWLAEAYKSYFKSPFNATDESSLVESIGKSVQLVQTNKTNFKITTAQDWKIAEKLVQSKQEIKIGYGTDLHRLEKGRPFILGGEKIKWNKGPVGHSDGDALLHAVTDAILGALGLGDIGEYFSDKNSKIKGISSSKIVVKVMNLVQEQSAVIKNVDCTVHLQRPKLGPYKGKIKNRIAKLLSVDSSVVNIKAKTAEQLGPIGEEKAIACDAVVLIEKTIKE